MQLRELWTADCPERYSPQGRASTESLDAVEDMEKNTDISVISRENRQKYPDYFWRVSLVET
jgi:hypothetical protein